MDEMDHMIAIALLDAAASEKDDYVRIEGVGTRKSSVSFNGYLFYRLAGKDTRFNRRYYRTDEGDIKTYAEVIAARGLVFT